MESWPPGTDIREEGRFVYKRDKAYLKRIREQRRADEKFLAEERARNQEKKKKSELKAFCKSEEWNLTNQYLLEVFALIAYSL